MKFVIYVWGLCLCFATSMLGQTMVPRQDIPIRDPFIYYDNATGRAYMYGTCDTIDGKRGFDVRETSDATLQTWSERKPVWRKPDDFWGVRAYWAPEVHKYKDKYYLFATFEAPGRARATQILAADSPKGPFRVHSPEPINGPEYFSLDGTLYIDNEGSPWMVYSREHVSIQDGEMRAVRLKDDLTAPAEPIEDILLFKASSAEFATFWHNDKGQKCFLTDGPQMLRLSNGDLVMAWSTNTIVPNPVHWSYTVAIAKSKSGDVHGPWVHEGILYNGFAGHGQIFRHPVMGLVLSVHQPNSGRSPYPVFLPVYEADGKLTMADPKTPSYVQSYWRFDDITPRRIALPSIDILDSSGKNHHLIGDDFNTVGSGSASVPYRRVPAALRLNLGSYDNSEEPADGAQARYLRTTQGAIETESYGDWTIELSLKTANVSKHQVFISRQKSLELAVTDKNQIQIDFGGQSMVSNTVLKSDTWYNIAIACNGSRLKLYVDSGSGLKLDRSWELKKSPAEFSSGRWYIGCAIRGDKLADQFGGFLDEIRISKKALLPDAMLATSRKSEQ